MQPSNQKNTLTKPVNHRENQDYLIRKLEKETQRRKNRSLEIRLMAAKHQLSMVRGSTAYRIGAMLIRDAQRPLHWPLIPIKLYRIYKQAEKRKPQVAAPENQNDILKELNECDAIPLVPIGNRICYVLHNSLPYTSAGYALRSHSVALALSAQGYDVQVITRAGYPLDVRDMNFTTAEDSVIEGIPYRRILEPAFGDEKLDDYMKQSTDVYMDFFRLNRPAYVMVASSFRHALPAIIAARRLGIPAIYEVRGFWEVSRISCEPSFKSSKVYEYQRRMEAETANAADQVFALTQALKDELVKRGVSSSHIAVMPHACDPARFEPIEKDTELREHLGIPEGVPVIGYIGSWFHYEGLDDLVRACGILLEKGVEFRCLIVGFESVATTNIHGRGLGLIENIIKGSKLADRIITIGRVPFAEVCRYYSLIDIAPFPRKALPVTEMVSPIKPLEALAMEKAVVVSSVGALSEMIDDGVTGLVFQKGSITDLAEKLERLIADDGLRQKLGVNGRSFILSKRSWANISTVMAEFFARLDILYTRGTDELSYIRKLVLDSDRPGWWSQLPSELLNRCDYLSIPAWITSKETQELAKLYKKRFGQTVINERIPVLKWKREDMCWRIVPVSASILDVGSGLGEFVNLVAMHNPNADITSVDIKDYDLWFDSTGRIKRVYESIFDLGDEHERDVVTCFGVIDHLPAARWGEAVEKLRSLAQKKLYVSVPFMGEPPLRRGDCTRFTAENVLELFPDATFTVFDETDSADDKIHAWILCMMDP